MGFGLPYDKNYVQRALYRIDGYLGEVDLDEVGTKFRVEFKEYVDVIKVKSEILNVKGKVVTVIASGAAAAWKDANQTSVAVEIENPLITSILENDLTVKNAVDSQLFPLKTAIYEGANVICRADFE
jgi:hypothetical protein